MVFLLLGITAFSQTTIPPATTWTPARNIINANFENVYDSIAANRLRVNVLNDSIIAHVTAINLRLLKSDTTSMLANYTRNGELTAAISGKLNISDTATMLSPYALTSELADAGTSIDDVRNEIADSLNVLRPLYVAVVDTASMLDSYAKLTDLSEGGISLDAVQDEIADSLNAYRTINVVGDGTAGPFFDGSQDGGQILYFYGDNGFYTALQGGAPTANRLYRLPIAALPSAGTTSLMNIDEYGNMGFIPYLNVIHTADSTGNAVGNYVTNKALSDSIAANLGSAVGITLNSGTLTLNGDAGTADDITFYTNGDGSYDLPAGGGNLTIMSQVQGWINDSLDARIGAGIELSDVAIMIADSTGNAVGNYVTRKALVDSIAAAGTGTGVSITDVRNEIADSLNAIRNASILGIALADSTGYAPGNYVTHTQLDAFSGGSVDSSLYVTVTRLTDSLDVMRSLINDLIAVVENLGVDVTAPSIDSIEIGNFADDTLVIYFNEKLNTDSIPASSVFYLTEDANEMGIASISLPNDTVMYVVLDSTAVYGSTYLLDYTRSHPYLQDSTGNAIANFSNRSVINNMPEPEAGVPTFLTSDGYTWSWLEANAAYLTLNGTQITAVNDKGSGNHDWTGNGTPGAQWDAVNEEIDFANASSANLELTTSPSSLPVTIYMVVRVTDWADGRALMYLTVPTARISQGGGTNQLLLYAGQYNLFADYTNGEYAVITATLNGATSSIQWNDDTPVTGNAGANGISGIYLGYDQDNANFSTKEVIVRNNAESAQNIADVKAYLYSKYSITP